MKKISYRSPDELAVLTAKHKPETLSLIKKFKKRKSKNLDDVVHELHDEYFSGFNCLDCANCCKTIGPRLTERDIDRLSKHLRLKPSEFVEQYIVTDEDNEYVFKDHPCPFLLPDNYCMVYEHRPKACREYPHTNRKKFLQILSLSHKNCETCPVVFEVFKHLRDNSADRIK